MKLVLMTRVDDRVAGFLKDGTLRSSARFSVSSSESMILA